MNGGEPEPLFIASRTDPDDWMVVVWCPYSDCDELLADCGGALRHEPGAVAALAAYWPPATDSTGSAGR